MNNSIVYFDNAATTKPHAAAVEAALSCATEAWFNPSAAYNEAVRVREELEKARATIASLIGARKGKLIFTSGGTEAAYLAVLGYAAALRPNMRYSFVTTAYEHPAVYNAFRRLEHRGYTVRYVYPDRFGRISPSDVAAAMDRYTALVSVMHVNNEYGSINDIAAIANAVKRVNPAAVFFSDGVQALGRVAAQMHNIDIYGVSAHKIQGFKGVGALYMGRDLRIDGIPGGGQEGNLRSGTENMPGILAFEAAASALNEDAGAIGRMMAVKQRLYELVSSGIDGVHINGPDISEGAPHILNMSIDGVIGETLMHSLEEVGILTSTGSACSSHRKDARIPASIGLSKGRAASAVRYSFSPCSTIQEAEWAAEQIIEKAAQLRRFIRR
ncbi:MAG: cysteine desulfurase family protein [Christensenellales bacterium]|jgi:cysteine desulfurase